MASASSVAQDVSEIILTACYETTIEEHTKEAHEDLDDLTKIHEEELVLEIIVALHKLDANASEERVTEDAKHVLFNKGEIRINDGDGSTNAAIKKIRDKYYNQSNEKTLMLAFPVDIFDPLAVDRVNRGEQKEDYIQRYYGNKSDTRSINKSRHIIIFNAVFVKSTNTTRKIAWPRNCTHFFITIVKTHC